MTGRMLAIVAGGLAAAGCASVSADYVAANAATIRTNSESTLATLDALECKPSEEGGADATAEQCLVKKAVLEELQNDQRQIKERAEALCTAAKSDCQPQP